jgi:hypothetical protein
MFNPNPGASLITITYHYYPGGGTAPFSNPVATSSSSTTTAAPSISAPAPGKPNPAFFQYLSNLARSYQSHSKPSLFQSSKDTTAERKELETTFREAIQSIVFTSPSLLGSDWSTRELILRTLYLCKQVGLDAGQVRKASYQVLQEWYSELDKGVKAEGKRREGLKAKREEWENLRRWTAGYGAGAGRSGDPYVKRQGELASEIAKEEREIAKVEASLSDEVEKHYNRVQRECPLD